MSSFLIQKGKGFYRNIFKWLRRKFFMICQVFFEFITKKE